MTTAVSPMPLADAVIVIEPPTILIKSPLTINADAAACLLDDSTPEHRLELFERLVESGANAELTYRSNVTTQLFERRIEGLTTSLRDELDAVVKAGGQTVEERLVRTLHRFEKDLGVWTSRYIDPSSTEGLPSIAASKLRHVTDAAIKQVGTLLNDGDEGALAKWADRVARQVQESERNILSQLIQKQTTSRTGVHRGRGFEETLSGKLAQVALAMGGEVQRCSDTLGATRMRHGDHILAFSDGVRIVIEAKSQDGQRFSHAAIDQACQESRVNREATAAVFVSETRECLPDGVPFGQVGRGNLFVEFDPEGDDVGLVAALYLARAAGAQTVPIAGGSDIDVPTIAALVHDVRERVEHRTRIRTLHASALKAINNANKVLDDDTEALLVCLARLDAQLLVSRLPMTDIANEI